MRSFLNFWRQFLGSQFFKLWIITLAIFTFYRFLWFIFNLKLLQNENSYDILLTFFWGVFWDLPCIAYLFLPVWIIHWFLPYFPKNYSRIHALIFAVLIFIAGLANSIDFIYSAIIKKRSGTELFTMIMDPGNKLAAYIYQYWYLLLICLGFLFFLYLVSKKTETSPLYLTPIFENKVSNIARLILSLAIWLICARGGFYLKPLLAQDAGKFVPGNCQLLLISTPMQMISTIGTYELNEATFMDEATAESLVLDKSSVTSTSKKNICIIVVESLNAMYTGHLNDKPYTPNLDSLATKSFMFTHCFANGTRSIEMVPSIFCGIPSLMPQNLIGCRYGNNKITNAFAIAEQQGYHTAFFHGGINGTMNFDGFLKSTGCNNYYGLNEYPNSKQDYDGTWGIYDGPFLQFYAKSLNQFKEPFFTAIFTLSSHTPFSIPEPYKSTLPGGTLEGQQSFRYTDICIGQFFAYAKSQAWFNNTIFVITADHTSLGETAYEYSPIGKFHIPLLIYIPENKKATVIDKTVSQLDIIPTVFSLAGIKNTMFGLGRNIFDSSYSGYSVVMQNEKYIGIQYPYYLKWNKDGVEEEFKYRKGKTDSFFNANKNLPVYLFLKKQLAASIQVHNNRLKKNNWYRE